MAEPADYTLLASALAGRAIRVEPARGDGPTFTDGNTISLAPDPDPAAERASVVFQSALIAAGSLDKEVMRSLSRHPNRTKRYLAIEGWRALSATASSFPPVPLGPDAKPPADVPGSAAESLALALAAKRDVTVPVLFGVVRPRRVLGAEQQEVEGGSKPSEQDVKKAMSLDPDDGLDDIDEDDDEDYDEFKLQKLLKWLTPPVQMGSGAMLDAFLKMMGAKKEPGAGGPDGGEMAIGAARRAKAVGSKAVSAVMPGFLTDDPPDGAAAGWAYPEWDVFAKEYKADHCRVREVDPAPNDKPPLVIVPNQDLVRRLARVRLELERSRHQRQGDDIDIDAVVESQIEVRAGGVPDDRLYVDNLRTKRNLSILVLLDISGSSAESASAGETIHERQRRAAGSLVEALHRHGDRVALFGFHSMGASQTYLVRVKEFDDPLDHRALDRLGSLASVGYTRLGAAVRHATTVLKERGETERQLLLVLSDGFPYDHGGYEARYGEADSERALHEARGQGVGALCLTLGASTGTEALRRVFGSTAYASADSLEDVTPEIAGLIHRALMSAELQRRKQWKPLALTNGER